MQVLEAHLREFVNHKVHHLIAAAEMMMERDCHPVLQTAQTDSLFERDEFRARLLEFAAGSRDFLDLFGICRFAELLGCGLDIFLTFFKGVHGLDLFIG